MREDSHEDDLRFMRFFPSLLSRSYKGKIGEAFALLRVQVGCIIIHTRLYNMKVNGVVNKYQGVV